MGSVENNAKQALSDGWGLHGNIEPIGDGHINDSFLSTTPDGRFVLQRVNGFVFKRPSTLVANQQRIVNHLQSVAPRFVPELISTRTDAAGWLDTSGDVWKLTRYVDRSRTCHALTSAEAEAAAAAFARYHQLLATLPGARVEAPIDGFLRLPGYLADWDSVAAGNWQPFVDDRRALAQHFSVADRYIHGDCKINNILFDANSADVAAVIDLDTTMWGHWAWDFGDLARSAAVRDRAVDLDLFAAVVRGYTRAMTGSATAADLVLAPKYMAFCLGLRFLTDHLKGNVYFKVAHPNENLERATEQFRLLESMEASATAMITKAEAALTQQTRLDV